jgi:ribosomal protein S18 acetylase RimI-like enzyme
MMEVVPLAAADQDAVAELLVSQMQEHRVQTSAPRLREVVNSVLSDSPRGFILVAKDKGRMVAVAYVAVILSVEHSGPVGWLEELYVSPNHRGTGVGTALLDAVLAQARRRGLVAIDLEVDAEHQRAESLYRRAGFQSLPRSRWAKIL